MGVYIKGIVMPDCCLDCQLYNGYGCKATLQMFHPTTNVAVRVEGCPLVEVKTPHGRLIDEGDVNERIRKKLGIRNLDYLLEAEKPIAMSIKESPTVIEADARKTLERIPSAENKGEWIDMPRKMFKCSECGQIYQVLEPKNFCPNCGADMRKGVDNE